MKCKSWSNKLNNFFTRKLTFLKINHQQQPLQQQQYQDCSSNNMPAMPNEKTTAFSLSKSDFCELQNKEQQDLSIPPIPTNTNDMTMLNNVLMEPEELKNNEPVPIDTEISAEENILKNGCGHADPSLSFEVLPSTSPAITTTTSTTFTKNQLPSSSTCVQNHQNLSIFAPPQGTTDVVVLTSTETSLKSLKTAPKKSAKDFVFGKYIGDGSFSTVYLGRDIHTKREYAIKVCEKRQILRESKQEYVRRERESLHILSNVPGFVNLHCTFQDNRSLYFVITYAKNGDLLPYINKVGSFDLDCTRHYAAELVLACENMHCRNVVHRDLKPENILLDENMHTLIADFGSAKILTDNIASILAQEQRSTSSDIVPASITKRNLPEKDVDKGNDDDNEKDQEDSFHQRYRQRSRKGSFVGTAQYVSPEVLQNGPITPAVDLWALGCIIYQMISGLPPFRGSNEYVIFKEIINGSVVFPQGFDSNAENLIRKFLKLDPAERIGALDNSGRYDSIRSHPFFNGIDFDTIREKTPPPIYPFLPGVSKDDKFHSHYRVPENLEPGLDRHQLTRLLSLELGTSGGGDADLEEKTLTKNFFDPSESEKKQLLEQQKSDKWHAFAENEVILKKGLVNKRKGLFARKRMLLLTTGPRLIYIDPVNMVKKGEIPWSPDLRAEPKNFKIFFVHTPNRTYYLEDPEGYCLEWVDAIDKVHKATYPD